MSQKEIGFIDNVFSLLQKDYRGVNLTVYAIATAGLALAIQKIRPVSKFTKASKVPDHFIKRHVPLKGNYAGVSHSPLRVLVNHKPPIYLPLWHTSKPPLPVKLWGVEIVSGNAVNWLECVAKGNQVTLKPIAREKDDLVSTVLLHIPQEKKNSVATIDIAQKLVEYGFAKASLPANVKKNTIESKLAVGLLSAEAKAKTSRNGIWSDQLPPVPVPIVYWRKAMKAALNILIFSGNKLFKIFLLTIKSSYTGTKRLALRSIRSSAKSVQST